jgi:hypothetical protein
MRNWKWHRCNIDFTRYARDQFDRASEIRRQMFAERTLAGIGHAAIFSARLLADKERSHGVKNNHELETDPEINERLWNDFWKRLDEQVLKPNALEIARIIAKGDIAAVIFEPSELACTAGRKLGWNCERPYFRLSNRCRKQLARNMEQSYGDKATARWLTRPAYR